MKIIDDFTNNIKQAVVAVEPNGVCNFFTRLAVLLRNLVFKILVDRIFISVPRSRIYINNKRNSGPVFFLKPLTVEEYYYIFSNNTLSIFWFLYHFRILLVVSIGWLYIFLNNLY